MVFLGFLFWLIIDLQIIYGINGFIFDDELAPIMIDYNIDKSKSLEITKQEIKETLKGNNINGKGFSFWYLNYNGGNNQFIQIENPITFNPINNGEIILIIYQSVNMILCHQALLSLNSVVFVSAIQNQYYFGESIIISGYLPISNGIGIEKYPNGDKYTGHWKNNQIHGYGVFEWINGEIYRGQWNNHQRNGYGTHISIEGNKYYGYWENNLRNGKGLMIYTNGRSYDGGWKNGFKQGYGISKWDDGMTVYKGEWMNNQKNGKGKMVIGTQTIHGGSYTGDFVNGYKKGNGIIVFLDNKKYIGQWENNVKHGFGMYIWNDGKEYIGGFKNNKREGYGKMRFPDGVIQEGIWKNDDYILAH